MLYLHPLDGHTNSWAKGKGPGVFLVAKREVLVACDEALSMGDGTRVAADIDREKGVSQTLPTAATGAGGKGHPSVPYGHHRDGGNRKRDMRVIEEDELGRVGPFSIHSPTTVLSGSSFTIPSSALVADIQRRRGRDDPAIRIVLEIVQDTNDDDGRGETGSVFTRGRKTPFVKKWKIISKDSASNGKEDRDGRVVARTTLDAEFLRRTIACRRSVEMMTAPAVAGDTRASDQNEEKGESPPLVPFARLDVAGHVVSARRGRPRLRLRVLECQNLRSSDMLGKSDPCVLVFWDGVEVGRTPIARDLNPVFSAAGSTFRLPLMPTMSTTTNLDSTTPLTGDDDRLSTADWLAYAPELRLEVWDMDRDTFSRKWKQGKLLGIMTLHGPGSITPVIEACTVHISDISTTAGVKRTASMLKLRAADRRVSKQRLAGKPGQDPTGVISIELAIENATDDSDAWAFQASAPVPIDTALEVRKAKFETAVASALDLNSSPTLPACSPKINVDANTGVAARLGIRCLDARGLPLGCDGYCRVFWNGRLVGSTLPASQFAQAADEPARKNVSAALALQRNPVWWGSSTQASTYDGHGEQKYGIPSSGPTAIVRLHENPMVEDELTLEVFDGIHMQTTPINAVVEHQASRGDSIAGKGADDAGLNSSVVGVAPGKKGKARRDMLGRSLGSVSVRGERLLNPPRGRIDLPLLVRPSSPGKGKGTRGITLSISLARLLPAEKKQSDLTTCLAATPRSQMATPEQSQHNDKVLTTPNAAAAMTSVTRGEGEQMGALEEEEPDLQRPARWLRLLLQGANLRKGLDVSGTSDPFCVVYVDRVWFSETRVCWGTLAPRWEQVIQIEVFGRGGRPIVELGLVGHEVRVEVWDKDLVGADDFIGEVHLFLHENQDG